MPSPRRLTVDAVLKMATAAAQRHADAPAQARQASADMVQAIAATWDLVKGRLGEANAAPLDALIGRIVGRASRPVGKVKLPATGQQAD